MRGRKYTRKYSTKRFLRLAATRAAERGCETVKALATMPIIIR